MARRFHGLRREQDAGSMDDDEVPTNRSRGAPMDGIRNRNDTIRVERAALLPQLRPLAEWDPAPARLVRPLAPG